MGKGNRPTANSALAILIAVATAGVAAYLGAFESLDAWASRLWPEQPGWLLAVSCVLAAGLAIYCWLLRSRLRSTYARHDGAATRLEREVAELRRAGEATRRTAATYRGVVANLPVALFAVDPEGVFTLTEGTDLEILGLEPERVVGRSIFETYNDAPQVVETIRLALAGQASGTIIEAGGRSFETRCSPLREAGEFSGVLGVATDVTERRRAETRLREAEARYRTLVEQMPAITYVEELSKNGKVLTYKSPQYEAMVGHAPVEGLPNPEQWSKVIHPDDHERVFAEDARTDETLEPFLMEYRMVAEDGRVLWVRDEAVVVRDEEGVPLFWQGVILDITERKKAEDALRESERRLSTLLANAPAYLYRCLNEPGWPAEFVSDYALELTGYTPADLIDGNVLFGDLIAEEDGQRLWDEIQEAVARHERYALRYALRRKDGEVRYVEEHGQGVYDERGSVVALEGVVHDVTERVRSETALRETEQRYRTLVEQIPAVTYIDKADGSDDPLYTSPQVEQMLGYTPEEWLEGRLWPERLHPDDRERVLAADERFESGEKERFVEEYRLLSRDESVVWVREEAVALKDESGKTVLWQGVIFDITERKVAEDALRESEAMLAEAQRMAHLGSWEWDLRTDRVRWSDETFRIYGSAPEALVPSFEKLLEVVHPDDRQMLREHIDAALLEDKPYDLEHRIVRPGGEVRVVHRHAKVLRDDTGKPLKMVGTVHDVTDRKALEDRLEHLALHDPLTGLPNRALFTDRVWQAVARAKRRQRPFAVLFMDIDNFKVINDSLGHAAGDRVLKAASKRIKDALRPEDTVARFGGDEFILLLEDTDAADATHVTERVQEQLRAPFTIDGRRLFVTASVGVAVGGLNGKGTTDILRDADVAMYRAKHSGKARYAVFEEAMNARALERLELEHDLRRAIERGELKVQYQPQMLLDVDVQRYLRSVGSRAIIARTATRAPRITGLEALVRWEHPQRGLLRPDEFIPIAEETGLIFEIGEVVLGEACRQMKRWHTRYPSDPPLAVCVNLSAKQFGEPRLTDTVRRILSETGLDPTCLHLEITESTAMGNAPATAATLAELKEVGVRMIIDDFGTGYSSLSYLERFPVDRVKIDRSFVAKLGSDPGTTALVSGMIQLAHTLDLETIAEGIETRVQLDRLQQLGCDLAQGFYFSEPVFGEEVDGLLEPEATTK